MLTEIEILMKAARKGCIVVEKGSNLIWEETDIDRACQKHRFQEEDALLPPCQPRSSCNCHSKNQEGKVIMGPRQYSSVGQTTHFVIYRLDAGMN